MARESPGRVGLGGPKLARTLSRILEVDLQTPEQPLSERLGGWLAWTDAIALASALGSMPPTESSATSVGDSGRCGAPAAKDYAQVVAMLERSIDELLRAPALRNPASSKQLARTQKSAELPRDYAFYRQRYASLQQNMETALAGLRARLRVQLSATGPGGGKLAMLDAALEQALAEREYEALAAIPGLLERHLLRLLNTESAGSSGAADEFHNDLVEVMHAEMELRLEPARGLLEALQVHTNKHL